MSDFCPEETDDARPVHVRDADGNGRWVADSGCSVHCVPSAEYLTHITHDGSAKPLRVADSRDVHVQCTGVIDAEFNVVTPAGVQTTERVRLGRVLVVPSFKMPLFSCSAGRKDGLRTVLHPAADGAGYIELPSKNRIYFHGDKCEFSLQRADDAERRMQSAGNGAVQNDSAHAACMQSSSGAAAGLRMQNADDAAPASCQESKIHPAILL